MGFHRKRINRGEIGKWSKVREELDEAFDAREQNQEFMLLIELSDMLGAVAAIVESKNVPFLRVVSMAKQLPNRNETLEDLNASLLEIESIRISGSKPTLHNHVVPFVRTIFNVILHYHYHYDPLVRFAILRAEVAKNE